MEHCTANVRKKLPGVTFHKFPDNITLRTLWTDATNVQVVYKLHVYMDIHTSCSSN